MTQSQPQVLLTPHDTIQTGTTTYEGSMALKVGDQQYTLRGTVGTHVIVEYHADFADAFNLGPVKDIASEIVTTFGFPQVGDDINTALTDVSTALGPQLSGLSDIVNALLTASAKVTDLEINTLTNTYGVGLALDFSNSKPPLSLLGIQLIALGFKVTTKKQPKTP